MECQSVSGSDRSAKPHGSYDIEVDQKPLENTEPEKPIKVKVLGVEGKGKSAMYKVMIEYGNSVAEDLFTPEEMRGYPEALENYKKEKMKEAKEAKASKEGKEGKEGKGKVGRPKTPLRPPKEEQMATDKAEQKPSQRDVSKQSSQRDLSKKSSFQDRDSAEEQDQAVKNRKAQKQSSVAPKKKVGAKVKKEHEPRSDRVVSVVPAVKTAQNPIEVKGRRKAIKPTQIGSDDEDEDPLFNSDEQGSSSPKARPQSKRSFRKQKIDNSDSEEEHPRPRAGRGRPSKLADQLAVNAKQEAPPLKVRQEKSPEAQAKPSPTKKPQEPEFHEISDVGAISVLPDERQKERLKRGSDAQKPSTSSPKISTSDRDFIKTEPIHNKVLDDSVIEEVITNNNTTHISAAEPPNSKGYGMTTKTQPEREILYLKRTATNLSKCIDIADHIRFKEELFLRPVFPEEAPESKAKDEFFLIKHFEEENPKVLAKYLLRFITFGPQKA